MSDFPELDEVELQAEAWGLVKLESEYPGALRYFNSLLRLERDEAQRLREENGWLRWVYNDRVIAWLRAEEARGPTMLWLVAEWRYQHPIRCRWFDLRRKIARKVWPWF